MAILHEADRRLFHAIVLMGAGLTGGTMACGGAVAPTARDSGVKDDAHADSGYGNIGIDSGYGNIGIDSGYGNIGYPNIDSGYGNISIDATVDSGYGQIKTPVDDAGDADAGYGNIDAGDDAAEGYPIIQ